MERATFTNPSFTPTRFTPNTLSSFLEHFFPLQTSTLSNCVTKHDQWSSQCPWGSGHKSSTRCLVFLTATFGRFACPQVVRRLRLRLQVFECSLLRAVAGLRNQVVAGLFAHSSSRVPVVYSTSAFWLGSAIAREAANCIQTSFRNNSADV